MRALAALVLVCVLSFAGWYRVVHAVPAPPPYEFGQQGSYDTERTYWSERIAAVGGTAAYKEFSSWASNNSLVAQHQLAHAFGEALYAIDGERGVSVCDDNFALGCFHVVLGKAIADHGLSEVATLDALCRSSLSSPDSCEHGIGHGIVAYLGYTYDSLTRALDMCDGLPRENASFGCFSGVFMEYNVRTMLSLAATPRPVDNGNLFAPCDTLAPQYKSACAYWQPQWWLYGVHRVHTIGEELYQTLGGLCDQIGSPMLVRSCYLGLGNIIPESVGYSVAASVVLCRASTISAENQLYCLSSVANVIGEYHTRQEGRAVCDAFTGAGLSYCLDYANGKANLFHMKDVSTPV